MAGIVVGIDESPRSKPALRWARAQGQLTADPVTAVMAWDFIDQHHLGDDHKFDPKYDASAAEAVVRQIVDDTLGANSEVTGLAVLDRPASALLSTATDASLLVVGARGLGGFKGLLLGSVSREVLHEAACPVAVVRDDADRSGRPVVVGINGSPASKRALEWAAAQAARTHCPLHVVYAWMRPEPPHVLYGRLPDVEQLRSDARHFLERQLDHLPAGIDVEQRLVEGRASAVLLDEAGGASMVVVGARGRRRLGTLIGSVADQMAQHATCPVVVVP